MNRNVAYQMAAIGIRNARRIKAGDRYLDKHERRDIANWFLDRADIHDKAEVFRVKKRCGKSECRRLIPEDQPTCPNCRSKPEPKTRNICSTDTFDVDGNPGKSDLCPNGHRLSHDTDRNGNHVEWCSVC